jgi:hypothetical protein
MDLTSLKSLYNSTIDELLKSYGLAVPCSFVFENPKQTQCVNCNYDPIAKKSANSYKAGGPINFPTGQLCPICVGLGEVANSTEETIYLITIFDYKKFINFGNVSIPDGVMQSICNITYFNKIKNADYIIVDTSLSKLAQNKFTRISEPQPVGLGDNNYIITNWQRGA